MGASDSSGMIASITDSFGVSEDVFRNLSTQCVDRVAASWQQID